MNIMNVLDWLQPFSEPDCGFTVPLSLTLLHFLWQGCVIAAIVYVISWLLQRSSATIRYWLHVGALLLMVACVSATFAVVSTSQNGSVTTSASEPENTPSGLPDAAIVVGLAADPPVLRAESDLPTDVRDRADFRTERLGSLSETDRPADVAVIDGEHTDVLASTIAGISPWLTAFYFAGVAVMLLRLTRSLWSGHSLRRESTVVDDGAVLAMIKRQARHVGLKTAPAVALCNRVTVLTVIGITKPMILLPASLVVGLAPQQLEALLAHELAHIRRFDLVVNLLQRLVEALLFFHPAVWFVSRRVSIERERACDDTVLAAGWQRVKYADALVRMAELSSASRNSQLADQVTAVAASGGEPSDLKRRVLRLLGHNDLPKVRLTQAGLTMFVVVLTLAVLAPLLVRVWAQSDGAQSAGDETDHAPDAVASDADVPPNESEPGKSRRPGMGDGRDIGPGTNGLPNEQKLSGKWYGEKDGIKVWLTFHSPVEARWKVDTGRARIGVSFRNAIDEEAGVINLWLDYKWVTGDKKGQSGSQVLGRVRDGARGTLLLNILPTDLYQPSDRYRPVKDVVLTRAESKDSDEPKTDRRSDDPGSREPSVREEQRTPDADQQLIETIDSISIFDCRKIIEKFDDAGKTQRACEARERLANRLERITQQPIESFTRPIPPDPDLEGRPSSDGGNRVGIQVKLDGVWSIGHGTAADWKDSIIRKQERYRTDRRQLLFQAGQGYRKLDDLESARRVLQAGLKGSEVYDEPVEKLISKYWPVSGDEGAKSLGSDPAAWVLIGFLRELAPVLRGMGNLDDAISVQTRLTLAHFSAEWDQPSGGPTLRAAELWRMIREKRGPMPPLFWFNVIDEKNPSITFDLSSARQKGSILQFHDQNVVAAPTHDFDELKITAEFHGKGGFLGCYTIPVGGRTISLGSIGFDRPATDTAQTVSKKIKAPANTGLIQFAVRGTEERVGEVTVEATFRKREEDNDRDSARNVGPKEHPPADQGQETRTQKGTGAPETRHRAGATKPQPSQKLGTLTGRFLYDGEPPKPQKISIGTERRTLDNRTVWTDPQLVHYSRLGLTDQSLIVGKDRGIKNIVVWIRNKDVPIPPRTEPGEKPVLRATGGRFEPRLLVFQAPHTLVLKNEETEETNVVNFCWLASVSFNRQVPVQQTVEHAVERPSVRPGPVSCSYFHWMKSWLFACKHPYFAASADDGTFRIENLPLGEWEFWVWHERTGYLKTDHWPKGRFTQRIDAGMNELGVVRLRPDLFEEKEEGAKVEQPDSPISEDPVEAKKPGTAADLRETINDLRMRANSLRDPKSLDVLANPDFEVPRQGASLPGWTFASGNGISVDLDPDQDHTSNPDDNGRRGHSLRVRSSGPVAWVRSNPFSAPKTGRLSVWFWLRIENHADQPPLRLGIEGRLNDKAYYRYAAVGRNDEGKTPPPVPLTTKWAPCLLRIVDVPTSGLSDLRVAVDVVGEGEVWIDDIQVFDLWFDKTERDELMKKLALADLKLRKGDVTVCERFLRSHWAEFLRQHVPLDESPVARPPQPGKEERDPRTVHTSGQGDARIEPSVDRIRVADPWRVKLSDTTWIELAGVTAHPQPHSWWQADGTPMDKGLISAYPKSPKPGKGDMVREIRVRARIPSDATIKVLFSAAGLQKESRTGANVPESNRSLSDYEFSHVLVDYPTTLRVLKPFTIKVADGEWKTLASCTADGGGVNNIRFEPAAENDGQVSLKAWFKVNVRDVRFVVEDVEGNRHVSTEGRELKDEGVSCAFEASVAVPRERIRMIHLQGRPFKWSEFRNVSLHPGYLTAASAKPIGITADRDD